MMNTTESIPAITSDEHCPFCRYAAGTNERCSECGILIPVENREAIRDSIDFERRSWLVMCFGCIASAAVFWQYAEFSNSLFESFYPSGFPRARAIYLMQVLVMIYVCLGLIYIAWRMRQCVQGRRVKQFERKGNVWSAWTFFAFVGAVASWILPVLAVIAILSSM